MRVSEIAFKHMLQIFIRYCRAHRARARSLSAEASWIIVGQIASVIGSLVLVRVLTEYLTPDQYGRLALGLTVAGLVNQVVMGGVGAGIGRYYCVAAEREDLASYLQAARSILVFATLVLLAIGLVFIVILYCLGFSQWMGLAAAALVFSVLTGYNGTLSGIQNAARQRVIVAFHSGLDAWLKILIAVGCMLWLGASSTAVVIGYACSAMLITVSQIIFLRRTITSKQTTIENRQQYMQQMWIYSVPFISWGVFTWMQQASDRWALEFFGSTTDVGQYAALFQLGYTPIAIIVGMAMSFFGPILYQRAGDATNQARNVNVHQLGWRIAKVSLMITLIGFGITLVLHEWIFSLLVASEYRASSHLLPWVVLAGGVFAAGQMLALKLMAEMKPSTMTTAKIVTALIGVTFNLVGAAIAGMQGVVGATIVFSGIFLMWMGMLATRNTVTT